MLVAMIAKAKKKRAPHSPAKRAAEPLNVAQLIHQGARRLERVPLFYGHGTDNPDDDAAALVFHALKLDYADAPAVYVRKVSAVERRKAEALFERRARERIPAVYLTGQTWFAGLPFHVDPRVLIPRSPIAELIERQFAPWVDPKKVRSILDIGTGSGCIAIACAKYFPRAKVDAVDISSEALAVARRNIRRHQVSSRVRALKSDYFAALKSPQNKGRRYDIIVSNPPYVGEREMKSLPAEYRHEPRMALAAGRHGLDAVDVILREAAQHLNPGGIVVVEVGNTQPVVERRYPKLPFVWLEFERGGGGVFVLKRDDLF
jgi:ribosomal protein L3 glutamine methyltransferase